MDDYKEHVKFVRDNKKNIYKILKKYTDDCIKLEEKNLEGEVTPDILREMGLTRKKGLVKILGDGEITKKIDLKIHAISEVAKGKIESAGGTVEIIKE